MFSTTKQYPYSPRDLEFLTDKTCLFLLSQFCEIYRKHKETSSTISVPPPTKKRRIKKHSKPTVYDLPTLGRVDSTGMPAGYSTPFPPSSDSCDYCRNSLDIGNGGIVLICGHGYHSNCYSKMGGKCKYCLEYYKDGIWYNADAFVKRLNANVDRLTTDDLNEDEQRDDASEEDVEEFSNDLNIGENDRLVSNLQAKLSEINAW